MVQKTKIRFRQRVTETMVTQDSSPLLSMLIFFQFTVIFLFYPLVFGEFAVALSSLWLGQSDPVFTRPYLGSLGHSLLIWDSQARTLGSLVHQPPRRSLSGGPLPSPMLSFRVGPSDFAFLLLT